MKKKIPWLTKEERKRMEHLKADLLRQLEKTRSPKQAKELERHILTLSRELEY